MNRPQRKKLARRKLIKKATNIKNNNLIDEYNGHPVTHASALAIITKYHAFQRFLARKRPSWVKKVVKY